ncbi:sugar ABC transporter ATP-binding protein [Gordoniibacillus kamchatkensis]|uniref:Sugar ABC transporter ATP-binding protein n=1 Tax=Gordoniibacillus kamchatkensis TaxID=1590651 RepID=A0ABR5ANG0_9BACL|nr:sugar ABC transporter ATP-binding protein [Paenibacillus sp. VKM B-2647]
MVLVYFLLFLFSIVFLFPLCWMFLTSVKELGAIYLVPPQWIPKVFQWENYMKIFRDYPLGTYLSNSVEYTIISTFGIVLSSSLVAFGFARIRARGKDPLFALVLATMMLPYQVTMIPQYLLFRKLGWVDSYLPLVIPAFTGSAFIIFLLRQFYIGLSKDLDEAVSIDGGGYFTIFFRIIIPLSLPAMATAGIMEFMYRWNDLLGPLIYLNTTNKFPLALGLANFTSSYGATQWNILMTAAVVSVIPPLLLFFTAQKYFIQGIVVHASKD